MKVVNYLARWNGYGTYYAIITGKADAPNQFRPLLPVIYSWILKIIKRPLVPMDVVAMFFIYEPMRVLGMWLWMIVFHLYLMVLFHNPILAMAGTSCMALFLLCGILFDYSDCYYEGMFWGLALIGIITNNWWLAIGATFIGTFNKETSVLFPFLALLYNMNWGLCMGMMGGFLFAYFVMFMKYGYREHFGMKFYGQRWMFETNINHTKNGFARIYDIETLRTFYYDDKLVTLFLALLVIPFFFICLPYIPTWLLRIWIIVPLFWLISFAYSTLFEMRVFYPMAYMLVPSMIYRMVR